MVSIRALEKERLKKWFKEQPKWLQEIMKTTREEWEDKVRRGII